ncbi:TonB-dependent receptor [Sandaracinobacter neustonicus]|uniref:TonB-dependent receptor n=1 Tax=Sandaracinobacter neustonicus TaxID=1715348 RepID=A0A501XFW0_9SPHN|nr:TonB-dependent receptor [Sandaracinobacter neustonicus]TPE59184.1 TonB-dependent receptor [Sandaracinobacter neustonicus]
MTTSILARLLLATSALGTVVAAAPLHAQAQPAPAQPTPADDDQDVDVSAPGAGGMDAEDIVVVGRYIPNVIRATPSVVSVLSAADMARTGEGDIAGALKRVTGLSVVGGKYVYVRGLGERYSLALLNGLPIPSPEPLKRVVPLDIFPTDLLASTMVQKSYSANFPGEFGGGVINLTTKAIPDEPFLNLSGSLSGDTVTTGQLGYTYRGSRSDWTSFDSGTRSIPTPLNAALNSGRALSRSNFTLDELKTITMSLNNEQTNLIQSNDTIPVNMSLGVTGGTAWDIGEDRLGVIGSVSWSNSWQTRGGLQQTTFGISVDGSGNQVINPDQDFRFLSTENRIQLNGLLGVGYEFGEHRIRFTNVYIRDVLKEARIQDGIDVGIGEDPVNKNYTSWFERQLFSTSLVGEFKWDSWKLGLRGTYAKSRRDSPYERMNSYRYDPVIDSYFNDLRTGGTSSTIAFSKLEDQVWAGAADVGYTLSTERPITLSAGYAYTDNSRTSTRRDFRYQSADVLPVGVSQQRPDFLLSPFNIQMFDIYLTEVSAAAGVAKYDAGLTIHAGYGQVEAELFDGFRLTAGVRYETAKQYVTPVDLFGTGEVSGSTNLDNSYWLPGVTLTWNFAEDMQGRFAISKTIARPQFRELAAQTYTDTDTDRTSFGNPYLVDSELLNVEGRYEWYIGRDERLTLGAFYKKIDKPIETISFNNGGALTTTFANAPKAELYGLEAEVQKYFELGGSGFFADRRIFASANYTFTDSKIKVSDGDTTRPPGGGGADAPASDYFRDGAPLTGQSDHVANLQLGLQNQEKLSEQTILLSYASDRVTQRGLGDTPDLIERPGVRLDFVAREEVSIGKTPLELKLEVRNILGTGYRESQTLGDSTVYNNKYDIGRLISFGITAKF